MASSAVVLGAEEDARVLASYEEMWGQWDPGLRETAWCTALSKATPLALHKTTLGGRQRRDWWYLCGSVSQLLPTEQGNQTPWNVNYLLEKTVYFIQFQKQEPNSWADLFYSLNLHVYTLNKGTWKKS